MERNVVPSEVRNLARRMAIPFLERDVAVEKRDIDQTAYLAFREALETWDPSKGSKLKTWSYYYVKKHLHEEFADKLSLTQTVPFEEETVADDRLGLDPLLHNFLTEYVKVLVVFLPEPHKSVITGLYGFREKKSVSDLAFSLGICPSRIKAIEKEALQELRQEIEIKILKGRVNTLWKFQN